MSRKVQLRLLVSTKMSEKGENGIIRLPRRVRESFGFGDSNVVIGKGSYQVSLTSKKAYEEDVRRLALMLQQGKLTEEEAMGVGFVTRNVQQRITRKEGEDLWVTTGVGNITVGCDPEFGLVGNAGILQRCDKVLPNSKTSKFGADGPGAEVRPSPSTDHVEVVKNIRNILENPPEAADKLKWIGGATYTDDNRIYWFGGHIHLGRPAALSPEMAGQVYERVAVALDNYLALPLVAFDTPNANKRRNGCPHHYGSAGDIRDDYPEGNRFEYRVLSGLWLVHPALTRMAIGVAKCVAETAYNKLSEQKFDPQWALAPANRPGLLKSLGVANQRRTSTIINQATPNNLNAELIKDWEKRIRALDSYSEYAPEVEALIELVKVSPDQVVPDLRLDLRHGWHKKTPVLPNAPVKLRSALEALS